MVMNKKLILRRGSVMLRKDKQSLCLACGLLIGIYLGLLPNPDETISCGINENILRNDNLDRIKSELERYGLTHSNTRVKHEKDNLMNNYFILIGVMTAKKYLNSRIIASFQTWAKSIPGRVLYFSSEGSETIVPNGVPVIGLKGVDDSYPPQKKSFLMIKYMFEYFGDQFQWFVRADDDIYIKADKMEALLNSINSSRPHYIGQAGLGNKDEFGMLNLDKKENYCMGGPGMVFSRAALMKMVPHISFCLKNLYTTHEDVEIGRCIQKMAEVSCTWAYEMQHLFYHNHKEPNGSFTHSLKTKDTDRAITLHPVKNPIYQFRLHNHFKSMDSQKLRYNMLLLQRQINVMDELLQDRDAFYSPNRLGLEPSLLKYVPKSRKEVISWEFLGKSVYSHKTVNPRPGITSPQKYALDDIIRQIMNLINHNARQRGRTIDFKEILYGYKRVDPLHSADYVLDLLLVYRKHKGRKMTIPVRRHAYLQQTFSELEFNEDLYSEGGESGSLNINLVINSTLKSTPIKSGIVNNVFNKITHFLQRNQVEINSHFNKDNLIKTTGNPSLTSIKNKDKVLHFIMPLSGRYETFMSFMANFDEVALKQEQNVVLSVMLFENDIGQKNTIDETVAYLHGLQKKYPRHRLESVKLKGSFSRGLGLEQGSLLFHSDALLVFIDVDMFIHRQSLNRIKKKKVPTATLR